MTFLSTLRPNKTTFLAALLLSSYLPSIAAEVAYLYGHSSPIPNILTLPREQTCPVFTDGLTSTSFPWTHNPTCLNAHTSDSSGGWKIETFCVYTNSRFANNRGISLITTPEVATEFVLESFSHEDNEDRGQEVYEARETPDRGIGLFSKRTIKAGESIVVKHPVLIINRDVLVEELEYARLRLLDLAVRQLPVQTVKALKALAKSRGTREWDDLVQTNAMGMKLGERSVGHLGVVPEAARINHACRPNSYYRFDDYTLTLDSFALKDIKPGEEITYSYGFSTHPHAIRQEYLKKNWGFTCSCSLCSANQTVRSESDERLKDIAGIKSRLPTDPDSIPTLIALLPPLIKLMDEEDIIIEKPMYEEILAYSWSTMGIEKRAKYWAERARRHWEIIAGKGSWEAKRTRQLEEDVKGHGTFATWDKDPWDDSQWKSDHDGEDGEEHEEEEYEKGYKWGGEKY